MYISPLGTEISKNHLSILKWSLNEYWSWKVWTLSFQMPCHTHFSEYWMQRFIISNEKNFLATFGNTFWGQIISIFILTNHFRLVNIDLEVNKCWPKVQNFKRMIQSTQISIYRFWNSVELEKSQIYMEKHKNYSRSPLFGYPAWLSTSYKYVYLNVKVSKGPSASQVHKSEDIEKSMGRIKKPCICFL